MLLCARHPRLRSSSGSSGATENGAESVCFLLVRSVFPSFFAGASVWRCIYSLWYCCVRHPALLLKPGSSTATENGTESTCFLFGGVTSSQFVHRANRGVCVCVCVCVCSGQSGQYWTLGAFSLGGSDDDGLLEVDLSVTSARSRQPTFPGWRCKNTGSLPPAVCTSGRNCFSLKVRMYIRWSLCTLY